MVYFPIENLLDKTRNNVYKLVILAARRAQELSNGAPKLVSSNTVKPTTLALEEISQGKVRLKAQEEAE